MIEDAIRGFIGAIFDAAEGDDEEERARARRLIGVLFFLVVAVDLGTMARSYFISQPRDCLFETESIRLLKGGEGTI